MTCRHVGGEGGAEHQRAQSDYEASTRREAREAAVAKTPDKTNYEIVDVSRVGSNLVLKVKYPSCTKCSYEGTKVLVYLNVTEVQVLKWRIVDPHFADPKEVERRGVTEAPSPSARFPATIDGWADALSYASIKRVGINSTFRSKLPEHIPE